MSSDNRGELIQVRDEEILDRHKDPVEYFMVLDYNCSAENEDGYYPHRIYFNTLKEAQEYIHWGIWEYGVAYHLIQHCPHCGGRL